MTVGYVIQPRLLPTLLLVGASLSLAALLAAIASALAVLIQRLETAIAPLGALCKALGRLMLFGQATVPVYVLSAVLIVGLFAILPDSARGITGQTGQLSELLLALVVLAPALALFPGLLTGQTIACEVTRTRGHSAGRVRSALLKGAATLLEQTGGILGASAILEQQFGWPGLGRAFVNALMGRDYPVALRLVWVYAGIVLVTRLLAVILRQTAGRGIQPSEAPMAASSWRKTARVIWVVCALALLVLPIMVAVSGLAVGPDAPERINAGANYQAPSAAFPWGTDVLGRDLRARLLRGGFNTLSISALIGLTAVPLALFGWAVRRGVTRRFPRQSALLTGVLRLPCDMLLFIPALVLVAFLRLLWLASGAISPPGLGLLLVIALAPRAIAAFQMLLSGQPGSARAITGAAAALMLSGIFSVFWLVTLLEMLGLGVWPPPAPTLGGMFVDAMAAVRLRPEFIYLVGGLTAVCSFCLYTAADALIGFFPTKQVMARFNR
jgi:ABC-type dipeptide/oligopeptide/nickel transport system permease subunit